jgi:hypothetical protein
LIGFDSTIETSSQCRDACRFCESEFWQTASGIPDDHIINSLFRYPANATAYKCKRFAAALTKRLRNVPKTWGSADVVETQK